MARIAMCLVSVWVLAACANPGVTTGAPTGIKAASGGGEQTLGVVGSSGALRTTVVR